MAARYQRVRGMRDILPDESARWREVEGIVFEVLGRYGYQELRLPLVEATELFTRGVGEATDLVEKEMYTFDDRKGKSLSLRPEGDCGLCSRLHRKRPAAPPDTEALLPRTDVPLRASTEGPDPATHPDRRRGVRCFVARDRCRTAHHAEAHLRRTRHRLHGDPRTQQPRVGRIPRALPRSLGGLPDPAPGRSWTATADVA